MNKAFRSVPIEIALKLNEQAASGTTTDPVYKTPGEVQILRTGTFHHPEYGTFEITPQVLLSMKKNFDEKVRGVDVAIDYSHQSDLVAAGWIKEVYLSSDGEELWAKVDWTPKASMTLAGKEYRYLSADFSFDYQDNESLKKYGPTLLGAGLTNRPVVKNMAPIELAEGGGQMDEKDKQISELKAQVDGLTKKCADYEAASKKAADEKAAAAGSADADKAAAAAAQAKKDDDAKVAAESAALADKKGKFDKMLSEGKAVEAQRDPFMSGDIAKFAELAQPLNLSESGHGGEGSGNRTVPGSAGTELLKLAEEKVKASGGKLQLSEAISQARAEKPELNKKYIEETKI